MALLDLVSLPARLTVAGVRTTLALGQLVEPEGPVRRPDGLADRLMLVIGEGGLVERLAAGLADPNGPKRILDALASALEPGRPLAQAIAPGGTLDRILARDGLLDRLLTDDGFVEKLVAEGGTLDQLVALGETLERIQPRLGELAELIPELHASVNVLNDAVEPLGQLANRIPGGRRRVPVESGG
jgi:hypothetical protein